MSRAAISVCIILWLSLVGWLSTLGYGLDTDAWNFSRKMTDMAEAGTYLRARVPGSPLFEYLMSWLIPKAGWLGSNLFSLLCGLGILWTALFLGQKGHLKHPWLSSLALGFAPMVMVQSSSTMDYIPSLCLVFASWALLLAGKRRGSALLLGLSCGFRLSGGLFLLPALFFLWRKRAPLKELGIYGSLAMVSGMLAFSPTLFSYGLELPVFFEGAILSYRLQMGAYLSLGLMGLLASIIFLGGLLWDRKKFQALLFKDAETGAYLLWIFLMLFAFFQLPMEVAYLLPILPFMVLMADKVLGKRPMFLVLVGILSYHFMQVELKDGPPGQRTFSPHLAPGYTWKDIQGRQRQLQERAWLDSLTVEQPILLMYAWEWTGNDNPNWDWDPENGWFVRKDGMVYLSNFVLDEKKLQQLSQAGLILLLWEEYMWAFPAHAETQQADRSYLVDRYVQMVRSWEEVAAIARNSPR